MAQRPPQLRLIRGAHRQVMHVRQHLTPRRRDLTRLVLAPQRPASELAREHLYLACAMIRGALCHLGVDCIVSADAAALPACDFTIVTKAQTA